MPENLPAKTIVFVVDDDRDGADSLAELMKLNECNAHSFYSGRTAVDAAASLRPDLVLVDLIMSEMDGFETCERLRRLPEMTETVIVAITGSDYERDDALKSEQFDGVFLKPPDSQEMLAIVKAIRRPW